MNLPATVKDFLANLRNSASNYSPSDDDRIALSNGGIEDLLYKKLTSKNFRKWKLSPGAEERIKKAIALHVKNQTPIKIVFEFGGYKLWRLPVAPEADWAEYFSIAHFIRYAAPVAALYTPGIRICFASDDVVVERMNNIPKSATNAYAHSFNELANYFNAKLPPNLRVEFIRLSELSESPESLEEELSQSYANVKAAFENWPPEKKQKLLGRANLNFCLTTKGGGNDLTSLNSGEIEQAHINGAIWHDAFEATHHRKTFVKGDDSILIFTTPIPEAIAIGMTKASVTKFWTGIGLLQKTEQGFKDLILSPQQIDQLPQIVANDPLEQIAVDMFPNLQNFRTINLSSAPINFSLKEA